MNTIACSASTSGKTSFVKGRDLFSKVPIRIPINQYMAGPDLVLERLYRNADYVVSDADVSITIRMDGPNPGLDALLSRLRSSTWAFLTAYNPNSMPASPDLNTDRQAELVQIIKQKGYRYLNGYGTGEDWEPEASLFILDISREDALALGRRFRQSAILWGQVDEDPELLWC